MTATDKMTATDNLPLATDIADLAAIAAKIGQQLDVRAEAARLAAEHPEADASPEAIKAALQEEQRAAAQTLGCYSATSE